MTELAATAIRVPRAARSSYRVAWALVVLGGVLGGLPFIARDVRADSPPPKQSDQSPTKELTLPEVTVRAQREALGRRVQAFVASSIRRPFEESLARWNGPICSLAVGLPPEEGEFIRARLSKIAAAAGAHLAPQPCKGNFVVIVSAQPDEVLKAWYARDYHLFGDAAGYRIDEFLKTPRTVRVWYNSNSERASGLPYTSFQPGATSVPADKTAEASHIVFNSVRTFSSIIVVFDSRRAAGVRLGQLADYAAMVGLAEIHLDADVGASPTILRLFSESDEAKPTGLSAWDTALLKALYHTGQAYKLQRSAITQSMVHDIAP